MSTGGESEGKKRRINADEDEEMPEASAAAAPRPLPAPPSAAHEQFSPELLRLYYDRLFPVVQMCRWLSYGTQNEEAAGANLLHKRELSFTTGDDVYIRYLSYEEPAAFKKDLLSKLPHKIDIGAIFSAAPRDHKKFKLFEPHQREFIIDIDLTDYDFLDVDVKRLETCDRCWPLMALASRVLTAALRDDFGFEQLLWVYSGRRGIHCWVCDPRARKMSNEVRSAVADYLGPQLNAATGRLKVSIPMHPFLRSAYDNELLPFFREKILASEASGGFGMLDMPARQAKLLDMFGDEELKEEFLDLWARKDEPGLKRWQGLTGKVETKFKKHVSTIVEIVFTYTYPRLDVNVSKGMNHLLKSPWCVHPKTGRVCVPVEPEQASTFDPSSVPTLRTCAEQLDAAGRAKEGDTRPDISRTQLAQYEAAFDNFLKRCESAQRQERARAKTSSLDF